MYSRMAMNSFLEQHPLYKVLFIAFGIALYTLALSGCSLEAPRVKDARQAVVVFDHIAVTSCIECHAGSRPVGLAGSPLFDHVAFNGTGECNKCHTNNPAVPNPTWAGGHFTHTPQPQSCILCHSVSRPSSTLGWKNLDPNAPFDYSNHGGNLECKTCHTTNTTSWAGATYSHTGVTQCVDCHSSQRPTSTVNGFNHDTSGGSDCSGCHQNTLSTSFKTMADWQGGHATPANLVWDPSQDIVLNTQKPIFSGTTIQQAPFTPAILHQAMLHTSSQLSAGNLQTCTTCHDGAPLVYLPGNYHNSLTAAAMPQPALCNDCHLGGSPIGFVGPANNSRSPVTGEMRHEAKHWISGASLITQDCVTCHTQTGVTWSNATYHAALTSGGISQPGSCLDCHANSRPTSIVPANAATQTPPFDHSISGMGDCISCHTSTTVWSGGKFHTPTAPASCSSCHASERPTNNTGWVGYNTNKPFDFITHGNTLDCKTCHTATTTYITQANWAGGNYIHSATQSACTSCHSSQRPTVLVGASNFNHSVSGVGDCAGCHQQSLKSTFSSMADWQGGQAMPSGLAGSKTTTVIGTQLTIISNKVATSSQAAEVLPEQILHSSSQLPNSFVQVCANCHSGAATGAYAGGLYHASLTSHTQAQPSLCNDCHINARPAQLVGASLTALDHDFIPTPSLDCTTCHQQPGVKWSDGVFHSKIGTTNPAGCVNCHGLLIPTALTKKMLHTSSFATQDCGSCHKLPTAAQLTLPALSSWAGGLFHASLPNAASQPTACTECHTADGPTAITVSTYDTQHMNHKSARVTAECATCHMSDTTSNPRAWNKSTLFHLSGAAAPLSCQECHGLGNGSTVAGTGNDIPAGVTLSDTLTSSTALPAGTYVRFLHTDINAAGKDCNVCHTQVGIFSAKWKSASFHTSVTSLNLNQTTGRCDNCHLNEKPTAVVSGMNHATIGTQDCSACHTFPGTGTLSAANWLGATAGGPHTVTFVTSYQNTCVSCHTASGSTIPPLGMPTTVLKAVTNAGGTKTNIDFAHAYTSTTAGTNGASTVTYNLTNCLGCHTKAATNAELNNGQGYLTATAWVNTGVFSNHIIPATVNNATTPATVTGAKITSCIPCHLTEGQTKHCGGSKTTYPPDCVRCHKTAGSWNDSGGNPTCK